MFQETKYQIKNLSNPLADVDITQSGSWVGITEFSDDEQSVYFGNKQVKLPEKIKFPIIRSLDTDTALVIDSRIQVLNYEFEEYEPNKHRLINITYLNENNAWIINSTSEVKANFSADDAIQDVVITRDFIVTTQFDEGAIGGDGLSVFDQSGKKLFGYEELFGKDSVDVYDCYAAALVENNQIIFCPYTEFPLVLFDIDNKTQQVWETPAEVHSFNAVTKLEHKVYFHKTYKLELEGYDFGIYEWQIGSKETRKVGEYRNHFVRGLPKGRFIGRTDSGYSIISLQ